MQQNLLITITKATLITGYGCDKVSFHTTFLSPYPNISKENLTLDFNVAAGDGYRYITQHLGIRSHLIETIERPE